MTIIAISASQGEGKTTLLKELHHIGFNTVSPNVARSVIDSYGSPLSTIYSTAKSTVEFQELLLEKYEEFYKTLKEKDSTAFVERSFLDVAVFTIAHLSNIDRLSSFIDDYIGRCRALQNKYVDHTVILRGMNSPRPDGIRPSNHYFKHIVDSLFGFTAQDVCGDNYTIIKSPDMVFRVRTVVKVSEAINERKQRN